MKTLLLSLLFICAFGLSSFATHFMAGYISYEKTNNGPNEYKITVTTFTDSRSPAAHRDEIQISLGYSDWGSSDHKTEMLKSVHDESQIAANEFVWQNKYTITHQFPDSNRSYTLKHVDPNLSMNYLNINEGQSLNVPAEISTVLTTNGNQSSPQFDSILFSIADINSFISFNGGILDSDNDRIEYELVTENETYKFPSNIGSTNQVFKANGTNLIWNKPERQGKFLAKLKVVEFKGNTNVINSETYAYITFMVVKNNSTSIDEVKPEYLSALHNKLLYKGSGSANQLVVYNLCGQAVVSKSNLNPSQTIELPKQPGVYIIQFKEGKHEQTFKMSVR